MSYTAYEIEMLDAEEYNEMMIDYMMDMEEEEA